MQFLNNFKVIPGYNLNFETSEFCGVVVIIYNPPIASTYMKRNRSTFRGQNLYFLVNLALPWFKMSNPMSCKEY